MTRTKNARTFLIPMRTYSESNRRDHWRKRHERVKRQRQCACAYTNIASVGSRKRYVVTLTRIGPRLIDDDNLRSALKAPRDGIADSLGIDDGSDRITWRYAQEIGEYGVRVEIE